MRRGAGTRHRQGTRLGQHLLTNSIIAGAVAESAEIAKGDRILEIGPGTGMLTRELLKRGGVVTAVEKDSAMSAMLKEHFSKEIKNKKLIHIEGDARDFSPDKIFSKGKYKVAANIPYYITGELIRACLTAKNQPQSIAFLVQKEVAERIARGKKESILSLSVKVFGTPKYERTVSRGNFNPAPNVDSAILSIKNISRKNLRNISEEHFFKVVKAGFAQKRKTLGGNLKKVFGTQALAALAACGLSEKIRAEDVALEKWLILAAELN
jgi:16S rRNA (adenine1518-N6/adenine1519-N6)-dimethyltransferase